MRTRVAGTFRNRNAGAYRRDDIAGGSDETFRTRQKELARQDRSSQELFKSVLRELSIAIATEKTCQDKQREKSAKREQRKQHKLIHGPDDGTYTPEEDPFGLAMDQDQVEDHEHQEP